MTHKEILRKVEWKDLKGLTIKEMLIENNLTIPWAISSWILAYYEYYWFALPCSAFFISLDRKMASDSIKAASFLALDLISSA